MLHHFEGKRNIENMLICSILSDGQKRLNFDMVVENTSRWCKKIGGRIEIGLSTIFFTEHFQRAPVLERLIFSQKVPIGIFYKIPIGMTLSEKIPIGISQNPRTGDFEFERKNPYRDFPL